VTADPQPPIADVRAIAEAVADVLAKRGLVVYAGPAGSARVLSAREVSRLLGRSTPWVYDHATELGAIRMGTGPKARIGFDLAMIEQWKRDNQIRSSGAPAPPRRRSRRNTVSRAGNLIPYDRSPDRA
jgi:predicted DNA-binding transcriptional regulator AlpA